MKNTFSVVAFSNNSVRHLPCSAILTTEKSVGFEDAGKEVKAELSWNNKISPNQNRALVNVKVSACHGGKNLTFICEETEFITDETNS
jgi:hypothetical protein